MVNGEDYNHSYKPYNPTTGESADSVLDYIFINWREPYMPGSNIGGRTSIGVRYLSDDGVLINSGSTQFEMRDKGGEWSQSTRAIGSAHEYVHYLFGGTTNSDAHFDGYTFYNDHSINVGNISRFALMTSAEIGGMFAYEKYRLGWLQPRIVSTNSSYVPLRDTHVLNEAILVPLRYENGNLVESFLIENFQTINSYPNANPFKTTSLFNHVFTNGILVFHIENENMNYSTMTSLDIETAEGLWDWGLAAGEDTPYDRSDDILIKANSNRDSGLDERDYIPLTVGGKYYNDYLALTPSSGGTGNHGRRYDSDDWLGDPQDFFSMEYANVFTKWSNPSTVLANGTASNIGFEIIDFIDTEKKYVLNIGFDESTLLSFSPSKVQNFKVDFSSTYPILTWDGNIEPDLLGYRVYKKLTTSSGTQTSYTFTTSTSYVDTDFKLNGIRKPFDTAEYWVVSEDYTNKLSVETEHYSTKGKSVIQWKKNLSSDDLEFTFKLNQNYPNPFNPSTMIKYQLPQSVYVKLKIYDMLGNEVGTLVSGYQEKGSYEIEFNAGGLSSGVYIYCIKAGNYNARRKMVLIK